MNAQSASDQYVPPEPRSIQDTGLSSTFLSDLALKLLYLRGVALGVEIADVLCLPFAGVVDQLLEFLKREKLCEVKGASAGLGQSTYEYTITAKGITRAREVADRGQYVGPAPVPLASYSEGIRRQPSLTSSIHESAIRKAVAHLVVDEETLDRIGPAVNSGRSIFLYGAPGNGKTALAESIGRVVLGAEMFVPYAVEVGGMIIKVFDEVNHQRLPEPKAAANSVGGRARYDRRWVRVKRPVITTGGELTLETLDLVWDDVSKYYEAPFQMKSNGGMFLIDDFGRQQVRPRDLLNRWVVPLEKRYDYLTLHTGQKIEVPFEVLIVFSTNLEPRDLVDEAFLRRIRHKIEIGDPSFEVYREIFASECDRRRIEFDEESLAYLLREHYIKPNRPLRGCQPRDLLDEIVDIARYKNVRPALTKDMIDRACKAYFVKL